MSCHPSIERSIAERRAVFQDTDGWTYWLDLAPPYNVPLEVFREGWARPTLCNREDVHPAANAQGLKWRVASAAKP
jgi:hypothetical protein